MKMLACYASIKNSDFRTTQRKQKGNLTNLWKFQKLFQFYENVQHPVDFKFF